MIRVGAGGGAIAAAVALSFALAEAASAPVAHYERRLLGDPPLDRPVAITRDRTTGELCITDDGARALDVFDAGGLHRFRTDPASGLRAPQSGCLDAEGGFVCTDLEGVNDRTIARLNFLGEPVPYSPEKPADPWRPQWLLISQDGNYVTLSKSGLLTKHDAADGTLMWRRQVSDPEWERSDLLGRPTEGPDGTLYVPHAGRGLVLLLTADGDPAGEFGEPGTKRGELAFPVSVALGAGGHILVLDRLRHSVLIYDADRKYVAEFGRVGYRPGDFYHPVALAAAEDGRVWVAQGFEGRLQQYRLVLDEEGAEAR